MLLTGCGSAASSNTASVITSTTSADGNNSTPETATVTDFSDLESPKDFSDLNFTSLDDPNFSMYMEDAINADLEARFASDDYHIDNIASVYISKEYLSELEYNSKENVFFGYSIRELDEQFQGKRYVFTLGDDGTTIVKEFEKYDDSYIKMLKDVAIGAGVIVFCITVSVVSAGVGAPAVSMIFAASAKTGAGMALSSGTIGGLANGIVTGIKTGDFKQALKAAGTGGAKGFKVGAITGAITGGATETFKILKSGSKVKDAVSSRQAPQIGRESEEYAKNFYSNGKDQVSFLNGKEVPQGTPGSTRPDILVPKGNGAYEAVEVKNYDLVNNLKGLKTELKRQVSARMTDLPAGTTQRIALVTKGRPYTAEYTKKVADYLQSELFDIYGGNIPIDIL